MEEGGGTGGKSISLPLSLSPVSDEIRRWHSWRKGAASAGRARRGSAPAPLVEAGAAVAGSSGGRSSVGSRRKELARRRASCGSAWWAAALRVSGAWWSGAPSGEAAACAAEREAEAGDGGDAQRELASARAKGGRGAR